MKTIKKIIASFVFLLADVIAFVFHPYFNKKQIWIFSEKKTEARDNGYHFFKYIREKHPEINAYYVITKDSEDRKKVDEIGHVINYDSFKHCLYYFIAKERVCSQIHGVRPFDNVSGINRIRFYKNPMQHQINLKHGISKDFRPDAFDYRKVGYDLYVSGAKPEYDYIKNTFSYPDKNIVLSGFCRFDALHNTIPPDKIILIMPTFRSWLRTSDSSKCRANEDEAKKFIDSQYFKEYIELLNNEEFRELCHKFGYKIIFYLHYTFQPYQYIFVDYVRDDNCIVIANRKEFDVQELLIKSSLLITDYSSVFFDYAYMHKPMVFFQFDKDKYREKHYKEGFFVYERDGFGPVVTSAENVIECTYDILENNCKMLPIYLQRAEQFFQPYDNKNCERVYNAILRLDE